MIISKTPLRMSFVGGGSDLPSFYEKSEGAAVSVTINKYIYVTVNKKFDDHIRLSYSKTENVDNVDKLDHKIVMVALKMLGFTGGIEITSIADIPSKGTGLGSSSAFTVGLLNALHCYKQKYLSPSDLARAACDIEINSLKEPIGKQDQYGTAFGGLKMLRFYSDGRVSVDPIICSKESRQTLEQNILMFYTGISRSAGSILRGQKQNLESDEKKFSIMQKMVKLAHDMYAELQKNNLDAFGEILHANWMYKKEMASGISTLEIDNWYDKAMKAGALGGKLLGAGGGGFLIFYAPKEKHQFIKEALPDLRPIDFQFENQGAQIIFIH